MHLQTPRVGSHLSQTRPTSPPPHPTPPPLPDFVPSPTSPPNPSGRHTPSLGLLCPVGVYRPIGSRGVAGVGRYGMFRRRGRGLGRVVGLVLRGCLGGGVNWLDLTTLRRRRRRVMSMMMMMMRVRRRRRRRQVKVRPRRWRQGEQLVPV